MRKGQAGALYHGDGAGHRAARSRAKPALQHQQKQLDRLDLMIFAEFGYVPFSKMERSCSSNWSTAPMSVAASS